MSSPRPAAHRVFAALGDSVRLRLVAELSTGERPAGDLVEVARSVAPISQPAVSRHLRVLREAELVTVRSEGTQRVYALDTAAVEEAGAWLRGLADPGAGLVGPLDALGTEVARGRRTRRAAARETDRRGSAGASVG